MSITKHIALLVIAVCLTACGSGTSNQTATVATLKASNLNLIFVQTLENNAAQNNLSIYGFNHSLILGQLLNQITAGAINEIFAQQPFYSQNSLGQPSMAAPQSIENYALLNSSALMVSLVNDPASIVESVNTIIAANLSGNYVFTMSATLINQVLSSMSSNPNLYFNFTPISQGNYHQYIVVTLDKIQSINATTYNDNISATNSYPQLNLTTGAACLQEPYTYTTPSYATPPGINTNQTVYFIRHSEAHPVPSFENLNYVCQGQWRAIGANQAIYAKIGGLPDLLYSSDPAQIATNGISYVRPALTLNPFAIYYNMPLNLISQSQFTYTDVQAMNSFFFTNGQFSNKTLLVAWEHDHIQLAIESLITVIYKQQLQADFPQWEHVDYDTIYKVQLNSSGQMTFSNTCEGIASSSLPLTCPIF